MVCPEKELLTTAIIDGMLVIDRDKLQWRRHGNNVFDVELKSEDDRVNAFNQYWGIQLHVKDREAIVETTAAVTSGT